MRSSFLRPLALASLCTLLSACGEQPFDRSVSGAGIGAAAGAATFAIAGAPAVTGLVVGAGTGLLVGGLTRPQYLDLGEPWWSPSSAGAPSGDHDSGQRHLGSYSW